MKNKSFLRKLTLANSLIIIIAVGTFYLVYNFLNNQLATTLEQRRIINTINIEINNVSINLYQTAMLDYQKHLTIAAQSSNDALMLMETLDRNGFDTKSLQKNYNDFFRYSVITTSLVLEHRLDKARIANATSNKKQKILQSMLEIIHKNIDNNEAHIIAIIDILMVVSSILLIVVVIINIKFLSRSFLALRNQESEQAEMINALGDGVYGIDLNGKSIFINHSALEMLGLKENEVLGYDQHQLFHHHYPDGEPYPNHACPIHATLRDRQVRNKQETFIRKDGSLLPVSLTAAPLGQDNVIVVFQDITTIKEEHALLDQFANYDNLTKLPNRRLFIILANQEIEQAKRDKTMLAIAFLDLDGFKFVNDNYGHNVGDLLLVEVTKRFEATIRQADIVARFGGDEFIILLNHISTKNEVEQSLKRIIEEISAPFIIDTLSLHIGVSIGYTIFPEDDSNLEHLIQHADNAMYSAKQSGKGVLKCFEDTNLL